MQKFRKIITKLGGFPGGLILGLPYIILLGLEAKNGNAWLALTLFLVILIAFLFPLGLASLTKLFFFKPRPIPLELGSWRKKIIAGSFPSMHTIAVMVFWILSLWFYPSSPLWFFILMWVVYGAIAVLVMISRVVLKRHFPIDILGGIIYAIVGVGIIALVIFRFLHLFH